MAHKRRLGWMTVAAGLIVSAAAHAVNDGQAASLEEQVGAMRAELQQLREDNARMQGEIDELHAATNDNWLTEQRAEEIRELVADVLADSDLRASHLQNGLTAGWSEHFFLASPDGRFKLQLQGEMQVRWLYSYHDAPDKHRQGFEHSRVKLTFRGHVFNPDLQYYIRGLFAREGGFGLMDSWIQYRLNNDWQLRIGQFKLPYTREELVSSTKQLAVERSLTNENLNVGRSEGIMFTYAADDWKFMVATHDGGEDNLGGYGSLAGTIGLNTPAMGEDVEWAVTMRYERLFAGNWQQFDDFTSPMNEEYGMLWGAAGHMQQSESTGTFTFVRDEPRWFACTTDLSVEWGGANLFGAFYFSYNDHPDFGHFYIYSLLAQGGVYFTPKLEVFARYQYGWWEFESQDFADLHTVEFGCNYYLDGHDLKWTTDIGFGIGRVEANWDNEPAGWRIDPNHSEPQIVFRTQLQLLF